MSSCTMGKGAAKSQVYVMEFYSPGEWSLCMLSYWLGNMSLK